MLRNEETNDIDIFKEEQSELLGDIYLQNIEERLRRLDNPEDVDCKRWIWELIQNAKDSISNHNRKSVDIEIIVDKDTYTFKHNGAPFKVQIKGDIEKNNKIKGFTFTMYREGEGQVLLDGLKRTEKSFRIYDSTFGWTSYTYTAITKRNKEAGRMGIKNFKENIAKVILNCPEINSIKLSDNGEEFTIKRGEVERMDNSKCEKLTLYINNNGISSKEKFLYTKVNEFNDKLTEKFGVERYLRICCAVKLDENNNIFVDTSSPCLFCSFPLVGSEAHELPFIINSPDFEPDRERQSILLFGETINEKTKKISDPGINKMILDRSQGMYETLLQYICNNGIGNRYSMARGLQSIPDVNKSFDGKWYCKYFICPMRNILLKYPIVWNGTQYSKLSSVFLPNFDNNDNENKLYKEEAYNYISRLYKTVPTYADSILIEKTIWKDDDNRLSYINIEQCAKMIESLGTTDKLYQRIDKNDWSWLDSFLLFVKRYHPVYLEEYAIIPNMNCEFIKQTSVLATSHTVPENMINCIEKLEIEWRNNHIHNDIKKFTTGTDHDIDYAVTKIRGHLKDNDNPDKKLVLMNYIPYDCGDKKFIEKRKLIHEFCTTLCSNKMTDRQDGSKFPIELWDDIDKKVFQYLIKSIESYGQLNNIITIDFLNKFLECVSEYYSSYSSFSIIPNKNGKLRRRDTLYRDEQIPELFKKCLKECFNHDIDEELIHDNITPAINIQEKRIFNYADLLKKYFEMSENYRYGYLYIPPSQKKKASEYLIRIIPKRDETIPTDFDSQNKQRELSMLYKIFLKNNDTEYTIGRHPYNEKIWEISNKYIIKSIKETIENYSNIKELAGDLGKEESATIEYLKKFNSFSHKGKVTPNQNGDLCEIDSLYNDGECDKEEHDKLKVIPDKLKSVAKKLKYDVKSKLVHPAMGRICSSSISYEEVCKEIDSRIIENYNNNDENDKNLKMAAQYIIEEYFDEIGDKLAYNNFPKIFDKKDDIILNVIYDKKTRKNMTDLGKKYGENSIPILLKNEPIVNEILNGELTEERYSSLKQLEKNYGEEDFKFILGQPELIKKMINEKNTNDYSISKTLSISKKIEIVENITSNGNGNGKVLVSYSNNIDSEQRIYLTDTFNTVIEYGDDFDFGNLINKRTGMCGEAYIYKLLKQSEEFENVKWNNLSENGNGERLEYKGDEYYVVEDGSHYDILCETRDGRMIYIEVKSTVGNFGNKVPFYISQKQIEMMKKIKSPNQYVLAVVFNVMNNPVHFFMTLKNDIGNNKSIRY